MEIEYKTNLGCHVLHLCNNSNIDDVVFSYIINVDSLATNKLEKWKRKFEERGISCPADLETWKRKFGETRIALSAASIAASKPPPARASRKNRSGVFRSSALTGRR